MVKEESKKEDIEKEEPIERKGMFRCKKCNKFNSVKEMSYLVVTQRNRPMEFEHIIFSSKASVPICGECRESLRRG